MNMRGCGSGDGLARQPYHSGRSHDVLAVLADLRHLAPQSPVTAIGFSLGGNLLLKLAGELQTAAATYLQQAIAVSPPADLAASVRTFSQPCNRVYEWRFIQLLKAAVAARRARFPDLPAIALPKRLSIYEFDHLYTAPLCGFADADDYYARASAAPLVPQIRIPCRILFAADDPFIDTTTFDAMTLPSNVEVYHTIRGGHLGFLGSPGQPGGYRWMDTQLLDWVGPALPTSALT
jgi:predicted alpha/beta-fold hydrolase